MISCYWLPLFFNNTLDAPKGVDNINLTAGHTVAVDKRFIRIGMPVLFSTTLPGKAPSSTIAIAQDVGGAIKKCKTDIYFGEGPEALRRGGSMKNTGAAFVAVPKP